MRLIFRFLKKIKDKEKLLHPAKAIPETAKDVYGDVESNPSSKKDEQKLPDSAKELPGSGESLPVDFLDHDIDFIPEVDGQKPVSEPAKSEERMSKNDDLPKESNDLSMDVKVPSSVPDKKQDSEANTSLNSESNTDLNNKKSPEMFLSHKNRGKSIYDEGFFVDFERFMNNRGLDENYLNEIMGKDLLHKMKQFHFQREEGMPFFFHTEDGFMELTHKLENLQRLEEEWYIRHRQYKEDEMLMLEKEAEIDLQLEELKSVMKHIKQREKLEKVAKKDNYFHLGDGRVLKSIGSLRDALKVMNVDLFNFHVTKDKNDFADWVAHVFSEDYLAETMRKAKDSRELLKVLYDF